MVTKRQNLLRGIGRQIRSVMRLRPLNTQEQSQQTWAKVVKSHDLPEIYQQLFQSHLSMGDAFPYTVLTPTHEKFGSKITGKLICAIGQALFVLEENAERVIEICYPIDQISYVEVSSKLLEFRVMINGMTNLGIQTSSVFQCSTVTDYLFTPIIERIRLRSVLPSGDARHLDTEKFDHWSERNLKFMNLARHCLLPGETVIVALLQPEIRSRLFSFSGKPFRKIKSPVHACILTEKELILIREDLLQNRKDKYGSTCNFVLLDKILSISMSGKTGNALAVSIQLMNQECFECLFESSCGNEVEELIFRTRERIPG